MTATPITMTQTQQAVPELDRGPVVSIVDALIHCSDMCIACADACLLEPDFPGAQTCVWINMDCADICSATARVLSRHSGYDLDVTRAMLRACVLACLACADHGQQQYRQCRISSQACRESVRACTEMIKSIDRVLVPG